jgi:hypothetical protein
LAATVSIDYRLARSIAVPYDDAFITLTPRVYAQMMLRPVSPRTMTHPASTARTYKEIVLDELAASKWGWGKVSWKHQQVSR